MTGKTAIEKNQETVTAGPQKDEISHEDCEKVRGRGQWPQRIRDCCNQTLTWQTEGRRRRLSPL